MYRHNKYRINNCLLKKNKVVTVNLTEFYHRVCKSVYIHVIQRKWSCPNRAFINSTQMTFNLDIKLSYTQHKDEIRFAAKNQIITMTWCTSEQEHLRNFTHHSEPTGKASESSSHVAHICSGFRSDPFPVPDCSWVWIPSRSITWSLCCYGIHIKATCLQTQDRSSPVFIAHLTAD